MKGNRMKSRLILHGWCREIRLYHRGSGSHLMALKSEDDISHTFWLMSKTWPQRAGWKAHAPADPGGGGMERGKQTGEKGESVGGWGREGVGEDQLSQSHRGLGGGH